jgi:CRP/FNR family transcriptional regulator
MRAATSYDIPCYHCQVRDKAVCAVLQADELERLNSIVTEVRLAKNQPVFHQDDPATHLFIVTQGLVRISKLLPDGRRQITGFLFPGDFLGVSFGDLYAYDAEAVNDVRLCRFPRDKLIALFDDLPELEHRILAVASHELIAAQDQMLLLGRKTAREKLVSFMLTLARRAERAGRPVTSIDLPMNRTDIADYLGLTTETVSRTLARLVKDGLMEIPSISCILLSDREGLEEIAESL